ncbi:hypothetical protein FRB93_002252 [Tulasnella sp. JGI-2019a]|nr:hypothetical protein FRB93_002252 [Tulasnella sp. JGI-2019a]
MCTLRSSGVVGRWARIICNPPHFLFVLSSNLDMGKFYDEIPESIVPFIEEQEMFWVGSAPLSGNGHVNISPKGYKGNETASHLYEKGNGRLTIMFTAFKGPPNIVRFWGKGRVHERGSVEYCKLIPEGDQLPGARAVVVLDIERVGTSCGYSIPFYEFVGERLLLQDHFEKLEVADAGDDNGMSRMGLKKYWAQKNAWSIDGLPGLKSAEAFKDVFGFGSTGALKFGGVFGGVRRAQDESRVPWLKIESIVPIAIAFLSGMLASSIWRG